MLRGTIVCVNHVTRCAAAAAKITGLIVGAGKREKRIEKTRLLQTEKNGIGAEQCAKSAFAQFIVGAAGFFLAIGISDFTFLPATAFKNTQHVARLRGFPAVQRRQLGQNALQTSFFRRGRRCSLNCLRQSVRRVAFAEARILKWNGPVVVKRRAPEHGTMRHHAAFHFENF